MAANPDKPHLWLGKYLSLAMMLPSCLFGGFLIGAFADHYFHLPLLRVLGILLGFAAGFVQILRELLRDEKRG